MSSAQRKFAQRALFDAFSRRVNWATAACVVLVGASAIVGSASNGRWFATAMVLLLAGFAVLLLLVLLAIRSMVVQLRRVRRGLICGHCGHALAPGRNASACPECGYHRVRGRFVGEGES